MTSETLEWDIFNFDVTPVEVLCGRCGKMITGSFQMKFTSGELSAVRCLACIADNTIGAYRGWRL